MWSSLFSFFSGYVGKALVLGCVFLAFFVLKLKLDAAQARLEKSRLEVSVLQNSNQKQHFAIQTLLQNQQKQNELLAEYEKTRQQTEKNLAERKEQLRTMKDNESVVWKKQQLPEPIRLMLTRE